MKYLMFECRTGKVIRKVPFIFTDELAHEQVARAMTWVMLEHCDTADVTSAGDYEVNMCICSGDSETLGLKSDPEDSQIIQVYSYMRGLVYK